MPDYADLTLSLSRPSRPPDEPEGALLPQATYLLELSYFDPKSTQETSPVSGFVKFPFLELGSNKAKPKIYGRILKETLFTAPHIERFFRERQYAAGQTGAILRLRVMIQENAEELHALLWETLHDLDAPDDPRYMALNANQPFSRFLSNPECRRIELREKGNLSALVVVANPTILDEGFDVIGRSLPQVPVQDEIARANLALQGVKKITTLHSDQERVTLDKICHHLADGYDILYLVCHGALIPEDDKKTAGPRKAVLLLEKADGSLDRRDAKDLANFIRDQFPARCPRLIVLASCQSAGQATATVRLPGQVSGSSDNGELSAAGPLLATAGVPAVLAMQGNISMETIKQFVPDFFRELLRHGQVDLAMAEARNQIRGRLDWWVPVIYLRLRAGRLWYDSGFYQSNQEKDNALFTALSAFIQSDKCIPILGPGLQEDWLDQPRQKIAGDLAKEFNFPLAAHEQWEMPQVAQFLTNQFGLDLPRDRLKKCITKGLETRLEKLCTDLGVQFQGRDQEIWLKEACDLILAQPRYEHDHYRILASLPFSIYINAAPNLLLEKALIANGRTPQTLSFCWKKELLNPEDVMKVENLEKPTWDHPLVFYILGDPRNSNSWVLSEDDYFDYLMWVRAQPSENNLPLLVRNRLGGSSLLFMGFQMSDWDFRVLFRSIFNADRLNDLGGRVEAKSVAVQIQPGDDYLHPEAARDYLREFYKSNIFNLYLGSTHDFITRLWEKAKPR